MATVAFSHPVFAKAGFFFLLTLSMKIHSLFSIKDHFKDRQLVVRLQFFWFGSVTGGRRCRLRLWSCSDALSLHGREKDPCGSRLLSFPWSRSFVWEWFKTHCGPGLWRVAGIGVICVSSTDVRGSEAQERADEKDNCQELRGNFCLAHGLNLASLLNLAQL